MELAPTIGLEVHAELSTATKMFCNCKNDPDETRPNVNICPICLAHPGTLPVINAGAVRHVLRIGVAVGGALADFSEFDRKSYFYPDIPKGYQISQYAHPLVVGGTLAGVAITRVHLEEDTARSQHEGNRSLIDFNRAGVPLMELVTEPVIADPQTAGNFARELQLLLRTLGAGEANLEKGEMRIEANVSVGEKGGAFGTKVEIKNLNSFRSVERAIAHEIDRQVTLIEKGERVVQETRGWDESKQQTFHQRFKEGSADYRYFPEPDLPKLALAGIPELASAEIAKSLPELPSDRRARYRTLGIKGSDVETLAASVPMSGFFDAVLAHIDSRQVSLAANYLLSDLAGEVGALTPEAFAEVIAMVSSGVISSRGAKDLLAFSVLEEGKPREIAKAKGLLQVHDREALARVVEEVIEGNASVVAEYRQGKVAVLEYLVGQAMKESKGSGNPQIFRDLFKNKLENDFST